MVQMMNALSPRGDTHKCWKEHRFPLVVGRTAIFLGLELANEDDKFLHTLTRYAKEFYAALSEVNIMIKHQEQPYMECDILQIINAGNTVVVENQKRDSTVDLSMENMLLFIHHHHFNQRFSRLVAESSPLVWRRQRSRSNDRGGHQSSSSPNATYLAIVASGVLTAKDVGVPS